MIRRKLVNGIMFTITGACTFLAVSTLFFILGYLIYYGGKSVSWSFLTQLPKPEGDVGGGMANAILGTGELLLFTVLMGIPIGFLAGVYLAEFGGAAFGSVVRYAMDLLNGVPSIVVGLFAYAIVVVPMRHFSAMAGAVALSVMVIPITVRSTEQFLRAVPDTLREGALALGASKARMVATVVVPAAAKGIVTGIILAIARVAGEAAPLLFTAFNNQFWSSGLSQPVASLPMMVYMYAISPYDDLHRQAWAAGLVLLVLMLGANVGVRLVLSRGTESHG